MISRAEAGAVNGNLTARQPRARFHTFDFWRAAHFLIAVQNHPLPADVANATSRMNVKAPLLERSISQHPRKYPPSNRPP